MKRDSTADDRLTRNDARSAEEGGNERMNRPFGGRRRGGRQVNG